VNVIFVLGNFLSIVLSYYVEILLFGPLIVIQFSLDSTFGVKDLVVCFVVIDVVQLCFTHRPFELCLILHLPCPISIFHRF